MIKDYAQLASTSLKHRRVRSWLTLVGIFIGIAAVISLIGLGQGLRVAVMGQFNFLTTDVLTIQASGLQHGPPGEGVVRPLLESYVDDISKIPGIDRAIGRLIASTQIEFNGVHDFSYAASIPDGKDRKEIERIANLQLDQGRMLQDGDAQKVVLGINYRDPETFGKAVQPRDTVFVQGKAFEVVGILAKKGSFIIDNAILINEDVMRDLFEVNDTYDVIVAVVQPGQNMARVKERVESYLRKERDVDKGEEDFSVQSPEQALANLDSTLFAIQIFIYVIAGISIVVGGIGIANTMYTSVVERTKQIGIMKALGAQRKTIFSLFLLESGFLGFVGGIVGIIIGVSIAYGLAFLGSTFLGSDLIRVSLNWFIIIGALLFSFLVGTIAGFLPAVQASKLVPVEALRRVT